MVIDILANGIERVTLSNDNYNITSVQTHSDTGNTTIDGSNIDYDHALTGECVRQVMRDCLWGWGRKHCYRECLW